jgi:hypothetical protein
MNLIIAFIIVITSSWIILRSTIAATDDPKKPFGAQGQSIADQIVQARIYLPFVSIVLQEIGIYVVRVSDDICEMPVYGDVRALTDEYSMIKFSPLTFLK